jgi:hypothetical protein
VSIGGFVRRPYHGSVRVASSGTVERMGVICLLYNRLGCYYYRLLEAGQGGIPSHWKSGSDECDPQNTAMVVVFRGGKTFEGAAANLATIRPDDQDDITPCFGLSDDGFPDCLYVAAEGC